MSEFSQISRLQEENRKVKRFPETSFTSVSSYLKNYFEISVLGFAGTPTAPSHVVRLIVE